MKAVVTGMIATYPLGGVVWDYGQYALALEHLGFEVYYLEDTGSPTYDPNQGIYGEDCSYAVRFLSESLQSLSPTLGRRWLFRAIDGRTYGMDWGEFQDIVENADLFLNVSGGCLLRKEYMPCSRKVLVDTDPGWNHFVNYPRWDSQPGWQDTYGFRCHDYFFTYAERLGKSDCALPQLGIVWHPTRPPVIPEYWDPRPPGRQWTTVMTWDNFRRPIEHNGVVYGTKELEFGSVERLPAQTSACFELAVGGTGAPREHWRQLGWSVVGSEAISRTAEAYRSYIQSSRGEFSVAKNVYAKTRSGWFSCRSVCYLAAGRPVVLQDTGFSELIPTGHGLFAFSNMDEAVCAIRTVERNYSYHQECARELARTQFHYGSVLGQLLERVGLG